MLFFGHIGITVGIVFLILLALKLKVDYRIVIIGSMLPDIIDKPLGIYVFTNAIDSGRIFCHTLLFVTVLALIALYLYKAKGQTWMACLAFGSAMHLVLDQMWEAPIVLYWPLYGFDFGSRVGANFIQQIIQNNYDNMYTYETEFIGHHNTGPVRRLLQAL